MILRISRSGRECLFLPENESETPPKMLVQPYSMDGTSCWIGTWIEATKYLANNKDVKVQNKKYLTDFLKWRRKTLEPIPTNCSTKWLSPEFKLRDYQKQGIRAFLTRRKLLLADDTGLGKTLIAIGSFNILRELKPDAKALFFTLSPLRAQWYDEVIKFVRPEVLGDNDIALVTGPADQRKYALELNRPLTILHYESVIHDLVPVPDSSELEGPLAPVLQSADMVVMDEATRLKNPFSVTSSRLSQLISNVPFRMAISATPIKRDVADLFGIFSTVDEDILGEYDKFSNQYLKWATRTVGRGRNRTKIHQITGSKNTSHLKRRIDYACLRRTAAEVGEELPELVPVPIWLDLDTKSRRAYRNLKRDPATYEEARLVRARQFCCDPSLIGLSQDPTKTNKILELVKKEFADEQILIFTEFRTFAMKLFEQIGDEAGIFVGGIPDKRRRSYKDLFDAGKLRVMIGDVAMYEGGNFQTAGVVINADLPWVPPDLKQRAGRAQRIGSSQKKIRVVTIAFRNTVEERMLSKLIERAKVFENIFAWRDDDPSPFEGLAMSELRKML